jgi:hypothetical protein
MSIRISEPVQVLSRISAVLVAAILGAFLCADLFADQAFAQYNLKSRRDFDVGDHPQTVLAVDFDNDGVTDLMSADELSDYVSLLKGFGDGTFRRTQTVVAGSKPTDLVFTDVNHDGFPDIVAANFLTQDVTVNLGNGTGAFGAKISSLVSAGPSATGTAMGISMSPPPTPRRTTSRSCAAPAPGPSTTWCRSSRAPSRTGS